MGSVKRVAFLFPGQGSQTVGMGRELADRFDEARAVFEEADDALGDSLSDVCWTGPEDELQRTSTTQPAIVTCSTACLRVFAKHGVKPDLVAGHSVGEYAALVAAGAMTLSDAVRLTRLRGELMESACPEGTGSMAAIMGLSEEEVRTLCKEAAASGIAEIAGLNCSGQVVVAGHIRALSEVLFAAKSRGAASATMLRVSGPFHTSLMAPAARGLEEALARAPFHRARTPVVANVDAQAHTDPAELKQNLIGQLTRPVLWQKSIELMVGLGIGIFVELGAGKVLSGLMRRIHKPATMLNVGDLASLEKTLGFFKAEGLAN